MNIYIVSRWCDISRGGEREEGEERKQSGEIEVKERKKIMMFRGRVEKNKARRNEMRTVMGK